MIKKFSANEIKIDYILKDLKVNWNMNSECKYSYKIRSLRIEITISLISYIFPSKVFTYYSTSKNKNLLSILCFWLFILKSISLTKAARLCWVASLSFSCKLHSNFLFLEFFKLFMSWTLAFASNYHFELELQIFMKMIFMKTFFNAQVNFRDFHENLSWKGVYYDWTDLYRILW